MPMITSAMLGAEGLQQADDLAQRLSGLFESLGANCTKRPEYDFGLRKLKTVCKEAGKTGVRRRFSDERQMMTAALQTTLASSLAPIDEPTFFRGVIEHFGFDAFVPMPIPSDFWNSAATKITRTVAAGHASLCMPVFETDETFVKAVIEEEAQKQGVQTKYMPGTLSAMSMDEIFGKFDLDGQWVDGEFTKAMRSLALRDQPGWLVVFCGTDEMSPQKWKEMHTLMDDNKVLCLANGERIKLRPDDRIIFAAPSVDGYSPATVSRLGIVNIEANHRQRL